MKQKYTFWSLLSERNINIPMIQRDYAQGRETGNIPDLRKYFVESIYSSITGKEKLELDFVYGTIDESKSFVPLDGQQRLTTLFLLHWYAASKERIIKDVSAVLERFTYQVRDSASSFCRKLSQFETQFIEKPSDEIKNQNWFSPQWKNDPTIASMLIMLDVLHEHLKEEHLWEKLTNEEQDFSPRFYVVQLEDFGIPDNIYIKMNSRGKELTPLEHFKARFLRLLREQAPGYYESFVHRSHMEWMDVFWSSFHDDKQTGDQEFITYIQFVTSLLYYRIHEKDWDENSDFFKICASIYKQDQESFPTFGNTLDFLFSALDAWTAQQLPKGQSIDIFFNSIFSNGQFSPEKLRIPWEINLFKTICTEKKRLSMAERLFFFAVLLHRIKNCDPTLERLRVIRNLLLNSPNEMRNEKALMEFIHNVLLHGDLLSSKEFNTEQRKHEVEKLALLKRQPDLRESVYFLEDHALLWGRLLAFDMQETSFSTKAQTFAAIFPEPCEEHCDFNLLRRALLSTGDYALWDDVNRGLFGNHKEETWQKILTTSPNNSKIKIVLNALLDKLAGCDTRQADKKMQDIINIFLKQQEAKKYFSWRYYFVKYENMLDGASGYYRWTGEGDYEIRMQEKSRLSGFHRDPFIWTACRQVCNNLEQLDALEQLWSTGSFFPAVRIGNIRLCCLDAGWNFPYLSASNPIWRKYRITNDRMLPIKQKKSENNSVYDCEDRILKILPLLKEKFDEMV
jgi:hypothetical protein